VGEIRIRRLEPVHDPEAYERVMRILGNGLRRGLYRLRREEPQEDSASLQDDKTPT
jgi:hypothetical protein